MGLLIGRDTGIEVGVPIAGTSGVHSIHPYPAIRIRAACSGEVEGGRCVLGNREGGKVRIRGARCNSGKGYGALVYGDSDREGNGVVCRIRVTARILTADIVGVGAAVHKAGDS